MCYKYRYTYLLNQVLLLIFFSEASSIATKKQTSGTLIRHALLFTRTCLEHMAFAENGSLNASCSTPERFYNSNAFMGIYVFTLVKKYTQRT